MRKLQVILTGTALFVGLMTNYGIQAATDPAASTDPDYTAHKAWLTKIAPQAQAISKKYGIYGSVQMAQAALESGFGDSGLSIKANNFFGIKGTGDSGSVFALTNEYNAVTKQVPKKVFNPKTKKMENVYIIKNGKKQQVYDTVPVNVTYHTKTKIQVSKNTNSIKDLYGISRSTKDVTLIGGKMTQVLARFAKFKSFSSSLDYNGDLLRNGLSWSATYYSGAWRENAKTYSAAAQALQGTYATDNTYAAKLISLIKNYNMDKMADGPYVTSTTNVEYVGTLANQTTRKDGLTIKAPATVYGHTTIGTGANYNGKSLNGQQLMVVKEVKTSDGITWAGFWLNNQLTYIDKRSLSNVQAVAATNKKVYVKTGGAQVYWDGTAAFANARPIGTLATLKWAGKVLTVTKIYTDKNKNIWYGYVTNGHTYWLPATATVLDTTSAQGTNIVGTISGAGYIYTNPGVYAYQTIAPAKNYVGQLVHILKVWVTPDGNKYYGFWVQNKLQWILAKNVSNVTNVNTVNKTMTLNPGYAKSVAYQDGVPGFMNAWNKGTMDNLAVFKTAIAKSQSVKVVQRITVKGVTWNGVASGSLVYYFATK